MPAPLALPSADLPRLVPQTPVYSRPCPRTRCSHLQVLQRLGVVVHVHAQGGQEEAPHEVVGERQLRQRAHVGAHRLQRLQGGSQMCVSARCVGGWGGGGVGGWGGGPRSKLGELPSLV